LVEAHSAKRVLKEFFPASLLIIYPIRWVYPEFALSRRKEIGFSGFIPIFEP